jgi:hypothetical protein
MWPVADEDRVRDVQRVHDRDHVLEVRDLAVRIRGLAVASPVIADHTVALR